MSFLWILITAFSYLFLYRLLYSLNAQFQTCRHRPFLTSFILIRVICKISEPYFKDLRTAETDLVMSYIPDSYVIWSYVKTAVITYNYSYLKIVQNVICQGGLL